MTDKLKTAAKLTIKAPGQLTDRGRREIANWLRIQAEFLEENGEAMTKKGSFTVNYFYTEPE